jgi:hypothetical protein
MKNKTESFPCLQLLMNKLMAYASSLQLYIFYSDMSHRGYIQNLSSVVVMLDHFKYFRPYFPLLCILFVMINSSVNSCIKLQTIIPLTTYKPLLKATDMHVQRQAVKSFIPHISFTWFRTFIHDCIDFIVTSKH